MLNWFVDLGDV